jgi:hypothetical protein
MLAVHIGRQGVLSTLNLRTDSALDLQLRSHSKLLTLNQARYFFDHSINFFQRITMTGILTILNLFLKNYR